MDKLKQNQIKIAKKHSIQQNNITLDSNRGKKIHGNKSRLSKSRVNKSRLSKSRVSKSRVNKIVSQYGGFTTSDRPGKYRISRLVPQSSPDLTIKQYDEFSQLNGHEPSYNPSIWNEKSVKPYHNCYAYSLDVTSKSFSSKPQPGYYYGLEHMNDDEIKSCKSLFNRVKADFPDSYITTYHQPCRAKYSKIYAAIDDSNNPDYHFYRLDSNGTWSHKPGATEVQKTDYDGKIIIRPDKAHRKSDSHYYNQSCGYMCINNKSGSVSDKPLRHKILKNIAISSKQNNEN